MRPTRQTRNLTATAALGAGLAVALVAAPARAADDGVPIDTKIIRSILGGLGLQRGDDPQIDYHERAPLVLPPSEALPPPASSNAAILANPGWPRDPDLAAAKAAADLERNRNVTAEREAEENRLTEDQMAPGAKTNPALARRVSKTKVTSTGDRKMSPNELGYMGDMFNTMFSSGDAKAITHFTAEPPRTALTEPPPGYQIPSPAQPYGTTKDRVAPRATDYYSTHGVIDSQN